MALFIATVLAVGWVLSTAQANAAPPPPELGAFRVLFAGVIAQMLLVACCTAIVMFQISRVGRTILKLIELSNDNKS